MASLSAGYTQFCIAGLLESYITALQHYNIINNNNIMLVQ